MRPEEDTATHSWSTSLSILVRLLLAKHMAGRSGLLYHTCDLFLAVWIGACHRRQVAGRQSPVFPVSSLASLQTVLVWESLCSLWSDWLVGWLAAGQAPEWRSCLVPERRGQVRLVQSPVMRAPLVRHHSGVRVARSLWPLCPSSGWQLAINTCVLNSPPHCHGRLMVGPSAHRIDTTNPTSTPSHNLL